MTMTMTMTTFLYRPPRRFAKHSAGKLHLGIMLPILFVAAVLWYIGMANGVVGSSFELSAQEERFRALRQETEELEQQISQSASVSRLEQEANALNLVAKPPSSYIIVAPAHAAVADVGQAIRP